MNIIQYILVCIGKGIVYVVVALAGFIIFLFLWYIICKVTTVAVLTAKRSFKLKNEGVADE